MNYSSNKIDSKMMRNIGVCLVYIIFIVILEVLIYNLNRIDFYVLYWIVFIFYIWIKLNLYWIEFIFIFLLELIEL